jgi:outer membrane protein TolC
MRRAGTVILLLWGMGGALAQDTVSARLPRDLFIRMVLDHHPMARQAALRPELAEATVRSARGGFDPVATANYNAKEFKGTDYYDMLDVGLKVPTWFGVDLIGGLENNGGALLDPQATTPDDGLMKAGVEVPLGQGLLIDQRRATLRRAQAFQRALEGERQQMLNQLLLGALNDHTDWVAAFEALRVNEDALRAADVRFQAVKGSWIGGDRPAIDTLEAFLQLQDRRMRVEQVRLAYRNAGLRLSNHLWDAGHRPLELGPSTSPDSADLASPGAVVLGDGTLDSLILQHPMLAQVQARLDQLEIDRRLRSEFLKPELDVKYLWLGNAQAIQAEGGSTLLGDGHQLGVGFKMPLLLRRERGELSLARLRVTEAGLGLDRERLVIRNRIKERLNDIATLREQTDLGDRMVVNALRMLRGENQRFEAGESSLFLVNAREVTWLESRMRLVDLAARLRKAHFTLDHDAGTLWSAWR